MKWHPPYHRRFVISMIVYLAAVLGSVLYLKHHPELPQFWQVLISLLPVAPVAYLVLLIFKNIELLDELQQKVQLQSFALTFAIVGLTTFAYGFLENVGAPAVPYMYIFPFMLACWGAVACVIARKYR